MTDDEAGTSSHNDLMWKVTLRTSIDKLCQVIEKTNDSNAKLTRLLVITTIIYTIVTALGVVYSILK